MSRLDPRIDHLLRRAGFGASPADVETFSDKSVGEAVEYLVDYEGRPDEVDSRIGRPDHAQVSSREVFSPDTDIDDARQRWPLREKMALFWHNHFATAYSKLAGDAGEIQATKMMAHTPRVLRGPEGQIELFRRRALGSFRDLLVAVAMDPAMGVWLDGQTNTREKPQENFGREVMEVFTVGVGHYTESDVYAAARVFTGWNLWRSDGTGRRDLNAYREFVYRPDGHDTDPKTFSFPIYRDGSRTIPSRSESAGMQDGLDLITALAQHPETGRRLARKLWSFFVSDIHAPDPAFVRAAANTYLFHGTEIRPFVRWVLTSSWFSDPSVRYARYSWPTEFVVRAIKEVGWQGLSLDKVLAPLGNMGQLLFEPPNVGGWSVGDGWFSTGTMLARTNFASTLAASQKAHLAAALPAEGGSPQVVLRLMLDRLTPAPFDAGPTEALLSYLVAGSSQGERAPRLDTQAAGLARLIAGSSEYQLV
jgi:uncharacterized protein (DUF1800 family)